MKIKAALLHFKKNFDRMILIAMVIVLILSFLKYIRLLREKSAPLGRKEFHALAAEDENIFRESINKKINLILGIKPAASYARLINRNPFILLEDLVARPFSLKPAALKAGVGEKVAFQTLNGIGPYTWKCEPKDFGTFEANIFKVKKHGAGRIIATDARGEMAIAEIKAVAAAAVEETSPEPLLEKGVNLIYKGSMKIGTLSGEESFAVIKNLSTGRLDFKKIGEDVAGLTLKSISQEKLVLFDKKKGKEIELYRE